MLYKEKHDADLSVLRVEVVGLAKAKTIGSLKLRSTGQHDLLNTFHGNLPIKLRGFWCAKQSWHFFLGVVAQKNQSRFVKICDIFGFFMLQWNFYLTVMLWKRRSGHKNIPIWDPQIWWTRTYAYFECGIYFRSKVLLTSETSKAHVRFW